MVLKLRDVTFAGQVLRGEADPLELYDGEDDDEDFVLDWDELMGANFGEPTAAGEILLLNFKFQQDRNTAGHRGHNANLTCTRYTWTLVIACSYRIGREYPALDERTCGPEVELDLH